MRDARSAEKREFRLRRNSRAPSRRQAVPDAPQGPRRPLTAHRSAGQATAERLMTAPGRTAAGAPGSFADMSETKSAFPWDDPLRLADQLSEEETLVMATARDYAQDKLLPRAIEAYAKEKSDPAIFAEM